MSRQSHSDYRVATETIGIRGRVVNSLCGIGIPFPRNRFPCFYYGYGIYRVCLQYLQGKHDRRVATVDCLQLTLMYALCAEFLARYRDIAAFANRLMQIRRLSGVVHRQIQHIRDTVAVAVFR